MERIVLTAENFVEFGSKVAMWFDCGKPMTCTQHPNNNPEPAFPVETVYVKGDFKPCGGFGNGQEHRIEPAMIISTYEHSCLDVLPFGSVALIKRNSIDFFSPNGYHSTHFTR